MGEDVYEQSGETPSFKNYLQIYLETGCSQRIWSQSATRIELERSRLTLWRILQRIVKLQGARLDSGYVLTLTQFITRRFATSWKPLLFPY